jgi:hypothetical protein
MKLENARQNYKLTHKYQLLQAAVHFQPLAQPASASVANFVASLNHASIKTTPHDITQRKHTHEKKDTKIGIKTRILPYKMQRLQAHVHFQRQTQLASTGVTHSVATLQNKPRVTLNKDAHHSFIKPQQN